MERNMKLISEVVKFVKGLAAAADRWNTDPTTDVVNMKLYDHLAFSRAAKWRHDRQSDADRSRMHGCFRHESDRDPV